VVAPSANANGRYPQASQIVVDPSDPAHWVARSTFGILETHDVGAEWTWTCEAGVGYASGEDPPIAVTADGSTLVAFSGGLRTTHDAGCSWPSAGSFGYGIDIAVDPSSSHQALAIARYGAGDAAPSTSLVETSDNGATWSAVGQPIESDFVGETIEIGDTANGRVYVSGNVQAREADSGQFVVKAALERSDDGGQTWTRFLPDLPGAYSLFIAGVDRAKPGVIYARTVGSVTGQLWMSRDGGATFSTILTVSGDLLGLALSPDGSTLVVGGPDAGILLASTADLAFTKVNDVGSYCLTWVGNRLLTCAKEGVASFSVGASDDRGATFHSVMQLASISPHDCPASSAGAICANVWPSVAAVIQPEGGGPPVPPPTGSNPVEDNASASSRCGCSFRDAPASPLGILLASLASALLMRRRARAQRDFSACRRFR
ncbi:MAG TPA: sialidase family protein, partial [Polyangiaceae bacterium]